MDFSYKDTIELHTMVLQMMKNLENVIKKRSDLSITQARILYVLSLNQGAQQINAIASILGIKPNTVTTAVSVLEQNGLVERIDSKEDCRIVFASLTKAGKAMVNDIHGMLLEGLQSSLETPGKIVKEIETETRTGYDRLYDEVFYGEHSFENAFVFWQSYFISKSVIDKYTKEVGISSLDFRVLLETGLHNEGITPSELASCLLVKMAEVSFSIKTLVSKNYLKRTRASQDRRSVIAEITDEGFSLLRRIGPPIKEGVGETSLAVGAEERRVLLTLVYLFNDLARKQFQIL